MKRRTFLQHTAAGSLAFTGAPALIGLGRRDADLILRGGTIIDGTGRPRFVGDLAITARRLSAIGVRVEERGKRELDCRGMVVAPGFVDVHSHADGGYFADPLMESAVRQGVTTVVVGADGGSLAPRRATDGGAPLRIASVLAQFGDKPPGTNIATLVGLGTVREVVVGEDDRPATAAELERMVGLVRDAIADGARGASSGLEYTPGGFAMRDELIALCKPLAGTGLGYHTHMRNEDDQLLEAVDEAIAVATGAGCLLQISHLKTQGPRNWPKLDTVFARIAAARAAGVDVAFDRYPYLAYQTGLTNIFPIWSRDGGSARFLERLADPAVATRMRDEAIAKVDLIGGWGNLQVTSVSAAEDKGAEGKRLDAWAREKGIEPYAMAVAMLQRNRASIGTIGFAMSEENLERILKHEWGMMASDGGAFAVGGPSRRGVPHPRGAGSFARVLGRYVRERRTLTLEQAVRKLSALPASRVKLAQRGTLAEGNFADVAVFDPATVADKADFADPFQYAVGFKATIVNGGVSLLDGERAARTGRGLRG